MKTTILLLITFLAKDLICPVMSLIDVHFRTGEVAVLKCPVPAKEGNSVIWKVNSALEEIRNETDRPVTQYENLLMFKVLRNDSGVYSCLIRNGDTIRLHASFNLKVLTDQCVVEDEMYDVRCTKGNSCDIKNILASELNSICKLNVSWFKVSDLKTCATEKIPFKEDVYFEKVAESNQGVYISNQSCRYQGQLFYTSKTFNLTIKESEDPLQPRMINPQHNQTIEVELGKEAQIMCKVIVGPNDDTDFMELHWINGLLAVPADKNMTVFYNSTIESNEDKSHNLISWLIFKKVLKADLNRTYTCKLESTWNEHINASITLKEKASRSAVSTCLGILIFCIFSGVAVTIFSYKMKIDIVLFCRGLRSEPPSPPDGKIYDAYMSHYKACSEQALTVEERDLLLHVLETQYGYRLCVYDRDVLPGGASADAVLEYVKQSQRLVLIPSDHGTEPEDQYGLTAGLHAALVERHTRLILIQKAPHTKKDSLLERLRLLARSGRVVTWKKDSARLSSAFWKHMRYYMPASRGKQRDRLTLL